MVIEAIPGARFRVQLVDDRAVFRAGLALAQANHPLLRDVLEVERLKAATSVEVQSAHLVMLDMVMPGINSLVGQAFQRCTAPFLMRRLRWCRRALRPARSRPHVDWGPMAFFTIRHCVGQPC